MYGRDQNCEADDADGVSWSRRGRSALIYFWCRKTAKTRRNGGISELNQLGFLGDRVDYDECAVSRVSMAGSEASGRAESSVEHFWTVELYD